MVLNNLGFVECRLGNMDIAEELFKQAEELAPHHPSTNINLGMLYEIKGEKDNAINYYKKVLMLNQDSPIKSRLAKLLNVPVTALKIKREDRALFFEYGEKDDMDKLWWDDNFQFRKKKFERRIKSHEK